MFEVHISKHSLFRLKITVGCLTSTYPSVHVETPSRSRSVVDCAHIQAFTFLLTKTLSRSRSVVWFVVWCVWCVMVVRCGGVLWCVVCVVLWWCVVVVVVCVVVLWWCVVVVCCGGACVWCVVKLGTLSLSLLLSLSFLFSFPFFLFFSLLTFFFSLLFSFFSFFLFFSCSFSYSCSCSCSFSFSSFFFLPFYSLFSSLPFTPTNTVQSTDQQTRHPTLRRLNVMWRTVRS